MTQREVAHALCIPIRTYQNYERGINSPDVELICQMADVFGVSVDGVVGHRAPVEPPQPEVLALSEEESLLLERFRSLLPEGQAMVIELARLLSTSVKFHDETHVDMPERI